jgi:hypothetical protein
MCQSFFLRLTARYELLKARGIEDLLSLAYDPIFRYSLAFDPVILLVVAFYLSHPEIKIISQHFRTRKTVKPQKDPVTPKGFHNKTEATILEQKPILYIKSISDPSIYCTFCQNLIPGVTSSVKFSLEGIGNKKGFILYFFNYNLEMTKGGIFFYIAFIVIFH